MTNQKDKQKNRSQQKKRKLSGMLRVLILIIAGSILGLNLYFTNAGVILGNQLPMPFGYGIANVLSGSMEPAFSKGTLLLVKDTQDIEKGDIVVYQSGRTLIVHRVRKINGSQVTTQGDANNTPDEPFDKTQIKGKVIGYIPFLGTLMAALKTPYALILIILCVIFLIEGTFHARKDADTRELEAIKEEIRRLKQETEDGEKDDRE